jgi:hypothetical protein
VRDLKLQRVHGMLRSILTFLAKAIEEAESFRDQALAEDLQEIQWRLMRVCERIGDRGQTYKRP